MNNQPNPKYMVNNAYNSAIGDNATINNYFNQPATADPAQEQLRALVSQIEQKLAQLPADDREMIQPAVSQALEATVQIQEGHESEEKQGYLAKRLQNIYRMAPDIGEVIITTLANPGLGIAVTIRKIAQKVAETNGLAIPSESGG